MKYNRLPKHLLVKIFVTLIISSLVVSCQAKQQDSIKMKKIDDDIIVFEFLDIDVTAIRTDEGIIVIDTQRSPSIMQKIKDRIADEFQVDDFLYIINTHAHWDHCSGNQIFNGVPIIGHKNCETYMINNPANSIFNVVGVKHKISKLQEEFSSSLNDSEKTEISESINYRQLIINDFENDYSITPPTITFEDSLSIILKNLTINFFYCGASHTNNHIFVSIPEKNLLFTGDMFSSGVNPAFPINKLTDVKKIIEVIYRILQSSNNNLVVVTGHNKFLTRSDLIKLKEIITERYEPFKNKKSQVELLEQLFITYGLNQGIQKYNELISEKGDEYYLLEEEFTLLGNRFISEGRGDEAIAVFKIGLNLFPNSVISLENLAAALLVSGGVDAAVSYYKESLQIFPENRSTQELLKFLSNKY